MIIKTQSDLLEIRRIMERSTKFLSLSSIGSVMAGIFALVGAYLAHRYIYRSQELIYGYLEEGIFSSRLIPLWYIAFAVFSSALVVNLWLSYKKSKESNQKPWSTPAKRLFINFSIPFISGAFFVLILFKNGYFTLLSSSALMFYGLSLLNAGNFTFSDIRWLGISMTICGLLSLLFPGKGLYFWAVGFGILHILYGLVMYVKYDRKSKNCQ